MESRLDVSSDLALTQEELALWRMFRKMAENIQVRVNRELTEGSALTGPEFVVLSRIAEAGGQAVRQQDLADMMRWEKSRLSHQLARMERNGFVERRRPAAGTAMIRITPLGEKKVLLARPIYAAALHKYFLDKLSPEQIMAIRSLEDRLV